MSIPGAGQLFQNSFYVGNTFNAIMYGVELVLYFQTINRLRKRNDPRHSDKFFMLFSTLLLLCITVFVATQSIIAEEMWVVHQDWPGGSGAYFMEYSSAWYQTFGTAASFLLALMSDALLVYRCWTVWCGNWRIIVFPSVLWLATLVFAILECYATGAPSADFFSGFASDVGLAYFSLTIGLNVITTSIICGRIISYAWHTHKELGEEFASTYFTTASIIVESALPYTLSGIAFLVAFGLNSGFAAFLLSLHAMFTCISPQMLILRVAEGRAWTGKTATQHLTTIAFAATIERPPSSSDEGLDHPVNLSETENINSERSAKMEV